MAENEPFEHGPGWDEYQWERFMKEQDATAERYMELFEQYMDEPDRDAIIAREMGWNEQDVEPVIVQWTSEEDEEATAELDFLSDLIEEDLDEETSIEEEVESHPLYVKANAALGMINDLLVKHPELDEDDAGEALLEGASKAISKLSVSLSSLDDPETGMTLAYLKRALKGTHDALAAAQELALRKMLPLKKFAMLRMTLFELRAGIVDCMGRVRHIARGNAEDSSKEF